MNSELFSVEFIFLPILNKNLNLTVKLDIAKIENNFKISSNFKYDAPDIKTKFYSETFSVYLGKENVYTFEMNIYRGITNYIFYDLEENNSKTFELLFYGKKSLPLYILYKKYKLDKYQTNGNKHRLSFCLSNVNPNKLEYVKDLNLDNLDIQGKSFQVLVKITNNKKYKFSLTQLKKHKQPENNYFYINNNDVKVLNLFKDNFIKMIDILNSTDEKNIENVENELGNIYRLLSEYFILIKKSYLYNFLFKAKNYNGLENGLDILFSYMFFYEFEEYNNDTTEYAEFNNLINYISSNNSLVEKIYSLLKKDNSLTITEKIKILQTIIIISIKCINGRILIKNLDYVKLSNLSEDNPFVEAKNLVKNIILNMNENSRIFEPFLYFNSGKIMNFLEKKDNKDFTYIDYFGKEIKYENEKYISEYGLSLLNVEDIKNNMKQLLPNIIIRINVDIDFRAYFEKFTNIMILNESKIFNEPINIMNSLYEDELLAPTYIIPIAIEILHEMMGHGLIRLDNEEAISPRYYTDSKMDFNYKSIVNRINDMDIPIPESGRVLEYYISNNKNVIEFLKYPCKDNLILKDYTFWVDENFDLLEVIILNNINKFIERKNE